MTIFPRSPRLGGAPAFQSGIYPGRYESSGAGVPAMLTSNRGAQFTSSVWSEVCSVLGILRILTTSFHSQSNGLIYCFHQSLKSSLGVRLAGSNWVSHLPQVMLGLRSSPKDDSGFSPAEAISTRRVPRTLRIPSGDFSPSSREYYFRVSLVLLDIM